MIIIKRGFPSTVLKGMLDQKTTSSDWLSIPEEDTKALRTAFDDDRELKEQIRTELYPAQNGLCAYCMAKISMQPSKPIEKIKIEHYKPISWKTNKQCKDGVFDYNNYFLVCIGGNDQSFHNDKNLLCCDSQKGNKTITINPTNQAHIDGLGYNPDGTIYYISSDVNEQKTISDDLNRTLGLNGTFYKPPTLTRYDTRTRLVERRKTAFKNANKIILQLISDCNLTQKNLEALIENEKNNPSEFSGVYLFYYKSILNRCLQNPVV